MLLSLPRVHPAQERGFQNERIAKKLKTTRSVAAQDLKTTKSFLRPYKVQLQPLLRPDKAFNFRFSGEKQKLLLRKSTSSTEQ